MAEITITKENFASEVLQSELPVLVDFWATWCGPCRMIAPVIDQLAAQFGIVSIPTVKVFRGGQCTASLVGLRSKAELEALIR